MLVSDTAGVVSLGALAPSGKVPVTGTFAGVGASAAFTPIAGRDFNVALSGAFVGTVQLEQSLDAGATWLPLMVDDVQLAVFTAPGIRTWSSSEVGAQFRLRCIAFTSGPVSYRVSQ